MLSVMGTAAIINHQYTIGDKGQSGFKDAELTKDFKGMGLRQKVTTDGERNDDEIGKASSSKSGSTSGMPQGCTLCHMSFGKLGLPVTGKMKKCAVCK